MLVEVENIGGLHFAGHYVLMPAFDVWCVVVEPAGTVISATCDQDRAESLATTLEAALYDDDRLGCVTAVRVYKATELRKAKRRERRDVRDYTAELRAWRKAQAMADAKIFREPADNKRLTKVS